MLSPSISVTNAPVHGDSQRFIAAWAKGRVRGRPSCCMYIEPRMTEMSDNQKGAERDSLILDDTSLVGCGHDRLVAPGYQHSTSWSRASSMHARAARWTAEEGGPCFVLVSPLKWYATVRAFAAHYRRAPQKTKYCRARARAITEPLRAASRDHRVVQPGHP